MNLAFILADTHIFFFLVFFYFIDCFQKMLLRTFVHALFEIQPAQFIFHLPVIGSKLIGLTKVFLGFYKH